MRKLREVAVGVGVIVLAFLLALPLAVGVPASVSSRLLPRGLDAVAGVLCLGWLAWRLVPPYLRWGHRRRASPSRPSRRTPDLAAGGLARCAAVPLSGPGPFHGGHARVRDTELRGTGNTATRRSLAGCASINFHIKFISMVGGRCPPYRGDQTATRPKVRSICAGARGRQLPWATATLPAAASTTIIRRGDLPSGVLLRRTT